jgi:lipid A 3-O-deacylase
MKARLLVLFVLCVSAMVFAQDDASALRHKVWEIGPWGGGGTGLGSAHEFKFVNAGVRFGRVLTNEIGTGKFRGTFEWAADLIPVYYVRQSDFYDSGPNHWIYGGGFNAVVLKWNWTANKKIVPYFAAEGGGLFTREDVPQADTSYFNFTPGGAFGVYLFNKPNRALDFSVHITHISNASLARNPGINATAMFRLGYTWFK